MLVSIILCICIISLLLLNYKYRTKLKKLIYQVNRLKLNRNSYKYQMSLFKAAFDQLPYPAWIKDNYDDIQYVNQSYNNLVKHEEYNYNEFSQLDNNIKVPSYDIQYSNREKALEKRLIVRKIFSNFNIEEIPLIFQNNILNLAIDIRDKQKIKQNLERYKILYADLLEGSTNGISIYNSETQLTFFNTAFLNITQLNKKWLDTHPTYDEVLEELRKNRRLPEQSNFPKFKQEHLKMFTELTEIRNEFFYLPNDIVLQVTIIPNSLGGLFFSYEDITSRLGLERAYNTLIAVQNTILDNLDEGVALYGENGKLKSNNAVYAKIWKLDQEFLDKKPHFSKVVERVKWLFKIDDDNWLDYNQKLMSKIYSRQKSRDIIERTDGSVLIRKFIPLPDGSILVANMDITDTVKAKSIDHFDVSSDNNEQLIEKTYES